jgi:hypothetical protein
MTAPNFRDDVIDRLARIEANQTRNFDMLKTHDTRITRVEGKIGRTMAAVTFIGTAAGAIAHILAQKLGLTG